MNQGRRYLRWLRRAIYFYIGYLLFAYIFLGISPAAATRDFGSVLGQMRQFLLQAIILMSFMVVQFVALFWFLARGTTYTVFPGEYDVSFDDVRGQPTAVKATKEVLRLFMGFKDFRQMGGYPPHGILFEGPPGTGKTLMAKAIAGATGVPFLYSSGSGFASMFMGIGNMKVRRMFKKARVYSDKYGGAVIFIDELDALGGSRGAVSNQSVRHEGSTRPDRVFMGGMYGGGMGIVNELLVGMDGFVMPRGLWRHVRRIFRLGKPKVPAYNVLIIGATNRAATLDPALLRPGRFDRKIHVGLPRLTGRKDIIRYYLGKVRHEPIDVDRVGLITQRYSPAQIKNLINEALIFALQDGRDALRFDDIWQAKLAEEIGLTEPPPESAQEREMVAVHEAGHFVASRYLLPGRQRTGALTIRPRGAAGGLHWAEPLEERSQTKSEYEGQIAVSVAGLVAEEQWFGGSTAGPSSDLEAATGIALAYVGLWGMGKSLISVGLAGVGRMDPEWEQVKAVLMDPERRKEVDGLLENARKTVTALLKKKRHVVEGIRDALLEREELIGDEIEELMVELGEGGELAAVGGNGSGTGNGSGRKKTAARKKTVTARRSPKKAAARKKTTARVRGNGRKK